MLESWRRGLVAQWVALPAIFAILLLLAYLQYRWIAEASEALMERRRRSSRFVLFTAIIAPGPLSQCKLAGSLRSALTQAPLRGS